MYGEPFDAQEERKGGERKTYSVPYNAKHRAFIVLLQPLVRVPAQVRS